MTIRKKLENELQNLGLWKDEASAVLLQLEFAEVSKPMKGRWDEDESGCPEGIFSKLLIGAKAEALKWTRTLLNILRGQCLRVEKGDIVSTSVFEIVDATIGTDERNAGGI